MILAQGEDKRDNKLVTIDTGLAVIGGGLAGVCCAISCARGGAKVVLIQDRPVLGGNASSEVRLWALGATSHMGNNNRWAREGGVIDEILVENLFRNREGNALILDTILLEKVWQEENITLLLNTAVFDTIKSSPSVISGVKGFCSQNSTEYLVTATFFCDASGDGIVGFQSGAAFRMGAESAGEFDEPFAPSKEYGELLGHSMYFMTKDLGHPVKFVAPDYALKDISKIPRYHKFNVEEHGCWLWWIEYGGRLDTVHDTEKIKWELWKVVYGVWDYIKNSGKFPEAEHMTLEWVSQIPGKRESRRFEGYYILRQSDIVNQCQFYDTVSYGGWAIDLHPADGVFSEKPGCNQWHSKGVYEIPYRCMISENIDNLFLAGRIISASHVAFGSTRVMLTCAHGGQAVGTAAALCLKNNWMPVDLMSKKKIELLQQSIIRAGQFIPHKAFDVQNTVLSECQINVSSELNLSDIPFDGPWIPLEYSTAQLIPLEERRFPKITVLVKSETSTTLTVTLRGSSKPTNFTPDRILDHREFSIGKGETEISLEFDKNIDRPGYQFLCFHKNEHVKLKGSRKRITGIVSVFNKQNIPVSNYGRQDPEPNLGFESFEFWVPIRRPEGHNIAMKISPGLDCFGKTNLSNGVHRPFVRPNAWVSELEEEHPQVKLKWNQERKFNFIIIHFDTDWDHPMETTLLGHPENVVPFVVRAYSIIDDNQRIIYNASDNYQTINRIKFERPISTSSLTFQFHRPSKDVPVAVFAIYPFTIEAL